MAGHLMARCVISGFNRRLQMPDHAIHLCKGVGEKGVAPVAVRQFSIGEIENRMILGAMRAAFRLTVSVIGR